MSESMSEMHRFDRSQADERYRYIIGVDEAGRGSLAGPMYAAAVVIGTAPELEGVDDSKRLTPRQRERLAASIEQVALALSVATVSPQEIDERGLDWANRIVLTRAVRRLQQKMPICDRENTLVLVDGIRPALRCPFDQRLVKGGDHLSLAIAAASIIAKTERDLYCAEVMDKQYPQYGFAKHKGYGTAAHYEALDRYGPAPIHRMSYSLRRTS